jgi:flagellar motor switch/type III secretory pathway protein FliN
MEEAALTRFLEVPLEVDVIVKGQSMRVSDLLALKAGSLIDSQVPAGANVDVLAGSSLLGQGELTAVRGKVAVRMVSFRGKD